MRVRIYTPVGRLIFDGFVDMVSFENYPKGIYFVKVGDRVIRFINK
jgi:hypothetical protein